jgi:hypothetical protein
MAINFSLIFEFLIGKTLKTLKKQNVRAIILQIEQTFSYVALYS